MYEEVLRMFKRERNTMKKFNFTKIKIKLLTKKQQESYENVKNYYICNKKFENRYVKDKKYLNV